MRVTVRFAQPGPRRPARSGPGAQSTAVWGSSIPRGAGGIGEPGLPRSRRFRTFVPSRASPTPPR